MKQLVSLATSIALLLSTASFAFAQSTQSGGMGNTTSGSQQKTEPPQNVPGGEPLVGTGSGSGSNTTGGTSSSSASPNTGGGSGAVGQGSTSSGSSSGGATLGAGQSR